MNFDTADTIVEHLLEHVLEYAGFDLDFDLTVDPAAAPAVLVEFEGEDLPLLLAHRAELLLALEHLATQALRLMPHEHDQVSFDAGAFKADRERSLKQAAAQALARVRETGHPYRFPPMSSRERRLLHMLLAPTGLATESEGVGAGRCLVLYQASGRQSD
jgi:spoIIIJ-associated protein